MEPGENSGSPAQVYDLKGLGLGLAAPGGILRRETLAAIEDAALIRARAEAEAARTAERAEAAFHAEMARGHAEGLAQAARDAAARLMAEQAALDAALAQVEVALGDLVLRCVQQILRSYDDEGLARETVRSALASMRTERRAQLHVSPGGQEAVRSALDDLVADFPEIEVVDLIVDPDLTAPNLRLESSLGVVEFVLDDTFADLHRLLRGG